MPFANDFKEGSTTMFYALLISIGGLIIALIVGLIGIFGFGWLSNSTADFRGKVQATNQIHGNGSYRIAAYNHFYDLCASIQTDQGVIKTTLDEMKTKPDKQRLAILQINLGAQRNTFISDVNQYNQDARKSNTQGQFKASDLPYQIDLDYTQEITCTA